MLEIYRKIEKTKDNLFGNELVRNLAGSDKPFLFCISAQDNYDSSCYGIIKMGARAARVNTTDERAAGFKIEEVGVDFLGYKYKGHDYFKIDEMVNNVLYPYLISKGKSIENLKRQARKMNFFTYCDGTETYKAIEKKIENLLKEEGIKEEDIKDILSQITLLAVETLKDTNDLKCNSIVFLDVNDREFSKKTDKYKNLLGEKDVMFKGTGPNSYIYIYKGDGDHSLKYYLSDECIAKPVICAVCSKVLERAIENEKFDTFNKSGDLGRLKELKMYGDVSRNRIKEALEHLDKHIVYEKATKYSVKEAKERVMIDKVYRETAFYDNGYRKKDNTLKERLKNLNNLFAVLEQYSLDGKTSLYDELEQNDLLDFEEQDKLLKENIEAFEKNKKVYDSGIDEEVLKIYTAKEEAIFNYETHNLKAEYINDIFSKTCVNMGKFFGKEVYIQILVKMGYYQAEDNQMLKKISSQPKNKKGFKNIIIK